MRVFLAIDIPLSIKKKTFRLTESIRNEYQNYHWVSKENYHITLFFFGEIEENKIERIKKQIEREIWDVKAFYLYSRSVGVFSNKKHVIYIDFYREKKIENLAKKIRKIFNKKTKNEHHYIPHLTLARGKKSSKQQYFTLIKKLKRLSIKINFFVNKVILYQSTITSEKPVYKPLYEFNLT